MKHEKNLIIVWWFFSKMFYFKIVYPLWEMRERRGDLERKKCFFFSDNPRVVYNFLMMLKNICVWSFIAQHFIGQKRNVWHRINAIIITTGKWGQKIIRIEPPFLEQSGDEDRNDLF